MTYRYLLNLIFKYENNVDAGSFLVTSPRLLFPIAIKDCLKTANQNCISPDNSDYPFSYENTGINLNTLFSALEYELNNEKSEKITIQPFFDIANPIKFPLILDDAFDISIDFETD